LTKLYKSDFVWIDAVSLNEWFVASSEIKSLLKNNKNKYEFRFQNIIKWSMPKVTFRLRTLRFRSNNKGSSYWKSPTCNFTSYLFCRTNLWLDSSHNHDAAVSITARIVLTIQRNYYCGLYIPFACSFCHSYLNGYMIRSS